MCKRLFCLLAALLYMTTSVGVLPLQDPLTTPPQPQALITPEDMMKILDPVIIHNVFGDCGIPCVVHQNRGGYVINFRLAAYALKRNNIPLVIDGVCASACAIAADQVRSSTCITPRAVFRFHKTAITTEKEVGGKIVTERSQFSDPPHSVQIRNWVYERGGYPTDGMLTMNYSEARKFWRPCTTTVMPKPDPRRAKARRFSLWYLFYRIGL